MKEVNKYLESKTKNVLDILIGMTLLPIFLLSTIILFIFALLTNNFPIFYFQERIGKGGKRFRIIKFRTMTPDAEKKLNSLKNKNEADGPVFKIYNDPRYTKIGKLLAHTGLDELPQFINVLKGEMSVIGPRPLPIYEAKKIPSKYKLRESIKPGISSSWIIEGAHRLSFKKWMESDLNYVRNANLLTDVSIMTKTAVLIIKNTINKFIIY